KLDLFCGKKRAVREIGNFHLVALGEYPGCLFVRNGVQFELTVLQMIRSKGNTQIVDFGHLSRLRGLFTLVAAALRTDERIDQRALFLDEGAERLPEYPLRQENIAEKEAAKSHGAPLQCRRFLARAHRSRSRNAA